MKGHPLHILGWSDGALRGGRDAAVGVHFQGVQRHSDGTVSRYKIFTAASLISAGTAYDAEFEAANLLLRKVDEFVSSLSERRGQTCIHS